MSEEKINKIKYDGIIELNNTNIECYVLEDGTRVLSSREMQKVLSMVDDAEEGKQTAGTRLTRYLNQKSLKPFIYNGKEEDHFKPIELSLHHKPVYRHVCYGSLKK
jgi:hypothetical protein